MVCSHSETLLWQFNIIGLEENVYPKKQYVSDDRFKIMSHHDSQKH